MKKFFKSIFQRVLGNYYTPVLLFKKQYLPNKADKQEHTDLLKRRQVYRTFIKEGDLVFDVSANVGNRIIPLLAVIARVVAIEPQETCYRYLEKKFGNTITLVKKGLSNKEGNPELYVSPDTAFSSFSKPWIDSVKARRLRKVSWNKVQQVQMTTLDNLTADYGTPAFIKIDVEGFELQVLQGITRRISMISYEYTTPEQTTAAQQCLQYLQSILPDMQYNYAIGESMQLEFTT